MWSKPTTNQSNPESGYTFEFSYVTTFFFWTAICYYCLHARFYRLWTERDIFWEKERVCVILVLKWSNYVTRALVFRWMKWWWQWKMGIINWWLWGGHRVRDHTVCCHKNHTHTHSICANELIWGNILKPERAPGTRQKRQSCMQSRCAKGIKAAVLMV